MERRRRDQKESPLKSRDFIDDDALGILPAEQSLRLLRNIPRQAGEGDDRNQPKRPGHDRKDQIQGNADQRSRRPRRQGRVPASETCRRERDEFFVQETPPSQRIQAGNPA